MLDLAPQALSVTLCFLVFYFLIVRPERDEELARRALVKRMEVGWFVITTHGMRGVVTALDHGRDLYEVEISPGVKVSLLASGVAEAFPAHTAAVVEIPASDAVPADTAEDAPVQSRASLPAATAA